MSRLVALEVCAGAGGMALGLERAGFAHAALIERLPVACATMLAARPEWPVSEMSVRDFDGVPWRGRVHLLAGGVPCPPFSRAGIGRGGDDERDLFPEVARLAREIRPQALLVENVRGFASARFQEYRQSLIEQIFRESGLRCEVRTIDANGFGVGQRRVRAFLVGLAPSAWERFQWPQAASRGPTLGEAVRDLVGAGGWPHVDAWAARASGPAPTIVGGSEKHGGTDGGPSNSRKCWRALGVDPRSAGDAPPGPAEPDDHCPRMTVPMLARLQGLPDDWPLQGGKVARWRQVGNALPPQLAEALGIAIRRALEGEAPPVRKPDAEPRRGQLAMPWGPRGR